MQPISDDIKIPFDDVKFRVIVTERPWGPVYTDLQATALALVVVAMNGHITGGDQLVSDVQG